MRTDSMGNPMTNAAAVDRKEAEREFHDALRGEFAADKELHANDKFYAIFRSNEEFVEQLIERGCRGKRVLDYCCGYGGTARRLARAGAEAYGIDISPVSVERSQAIAAQEGLSDSVKFMVMDAEATEFPDSFFDLILVNGVLHHLDLLKAYKELARITKPDGIVIATEALRHNLAIHLYRRLTPHLRTAWEVEHILGKSEIFSASRHFNRVEVLKFFHLATLLAVPLRNSALFEPMRRALQALDSILLRLPILKWQAWVAVFMLAAPQKPQTN